jgi:hypothetical protein
MDKKCVARIFYPDGTVGSFVDIDPESIRVEGTCVCFTTEKDGKIATSCPYYIWWPYE